MERYPVYLKYFKELKEEGFSEVSSPKIAVRLGYSEEQVRKDLQAVSRVSGKPKRGRDLDQLIEDLEEFLGYRAPKAAILIGAGHLGAALLNYPPFEEMGIRILAAFDIDEEVIGKSIGGKTVYHLNELPNVLPSLGASIAIIAVPASAAQEVADLSLSCGIAGIWNFAPTSLSVPDGAAIVNVNLASSLAVLSHRLSRGSN